MFAVEVHNLRKEFFRRDATRTRGRKRRRRVAALEGVTFTIARGECVAILGQNGSGKSTLVRLLSTLLLPDGGSATIFGQSIHALIEDHFNLDDLGDQLLKNGIAVTEIRPLAPSLEDVFVELTCKHQAMLEAARA